MSGELPIGWFACTLGDIVERIETGKSVKCDERPPQGEENGLVKISAVTWGKFNEQESKTLFDSAHLKPEEKIQLGDFLISRANTLELVGSCVLVKQLTKNLYLSDKVLRLVLADESKPWLLACLRTRNGRKQIESLATGNQLSMRNISQQALKEIQIPLPPLAEQIRIAQKLDELLAQVDTLKARISTIPTLLKRFRQSVLVAAVSGRLTASWRTENTGVDLGEQIDKILSDRSFASKSKKATATHLENEEYEIPSTWRWVSLDSLAAKIVDGTHHTPNYVDRGIPFISVKDIRDGTIDFTNTKFITAEEHSELSKRCNPEEGDLLITKSGTIGRTAIVPKSNEFSLFVSVALIKPASKLVNMQFINIALSKWVGSIDVSSRIVGSAIKNLHLTDMKVLAIPFAPLAEQTEIVRRVEQLFAFSDQVEAKVGSAKSRIDHLTQSILAKALRGELVPQDLNDEPASSLLQRIQAQRAAAPKAKRGRKVSI